MAAKLKKRALAEYHSQVEQVQVKHLKLVEPVVSSDQDVAAAAGTAGDSDASNDVLKSLDNAGESREVSGLICELSDRIRTNSAELLQVIDRKLVDSTTTPEVKAQLYQALARFLSTAGGVPLQLLREKVGSWVSQLKTADSAVKSAVLSLLSQWFEIGEKIGAESGELLWEMARECLKTPRDHLLKVHSLRVLGTGIGALSAHDRSLGPEILTLVGKYTQSQDARVRHAAFEALLKIQGLGFKLDTSLYADFCLALNDDHESVRSVALHLIRALAAANPHETIRKGGDGTVVRLLDDGFGKICSAVNDLSVRVRQTAMGLLGSMSGVGQTFLEQTLDKKLMSNMREKRSAHEQWSSGKKWADDAPREELRADDVQLMSFGACGAFVHGLEDEFVSVRSQAIESLTALSTTNAKLASLALDFLVDMFNDEIEAVRLKAIESLTKIAGHDDIVLQVHQLETIMSALDDFSMTVREKLHAMLQSTKIATKDGLKKVISKLLENLKRYPQDKRSILVTFRQLGLRHADLTLPLVAQLLEVHPFFDTAEPDIEDPAYLCVLVLVYNASFKAPTLSPLLDHHTRRHFHFLADTYPYLIGGADAPQQPQKTRSMLKFLHQVLDRVQAASGSIQTLQTALKDLSRLDSDGAHFAKIYVECQLLILRSLASKFSSGRMDRLFRLCAELEHRFVGVGPDEKRQVLLLKLQAMAVHLVHLVKGSNKSALYPTELFLKEVESLKKTLKEARSAAETAFFDQVVDKLSGIERKPGVVVRMLQPLLLSTPLTALRPSEDFEGIRMSTVKIYEPSGTNETPLKYTAGMVLAVPVDCDLVNVRDVSSIRLAIKTPDQKTMLVRPKSSDFCDKGDDCYRLFTSALMSHPVWSEALHVEISVVIASPQSKLSPQNQCVPLCDPVKVFVLPKPIKRGI